MLIEIIFVIPTSENLREGPVVLELENALDISKKAEQFLQKQLDNERLMHEAEVRGIHAAGKASILLRT